MAAYSLSVNGSSVSMEADDPNTPLLYLLQENLKLTGPKFGCGLGQCGACTVLLDGQPIRSCVTAISDSAGHQVTTVEGLGTVDNPHPIQAAFIAQQAMQCGYCISGPMLYGYAFLQQNPNATADQILQALSEPVAGKLLCRCHSHQRILQALVSYAQGVS